MDSSQKLTNTDVKKLNKNRIFRLIYNSDKISRQEIADQLGLSLPTVNQNLKMLMEDGLIEYVGNKGWISGYSTDNSHIICLTDILNICSINKKLHNKILLVNHLLIVLNTFFIAG